MGKAIDDMFFSFSLHLVEAINQLLLKNAFTWTLYLIFMKYLQRSKCFRHRFSAFGPTGINVSVIVSLEVNVRIRY